MVPPTVAANRSVVGGDQRHMIHGCGRGVNRRPGRAAAVEVVRSDVNLSDRGCVLASSSGIVDGTVIARW
jgi:hypothetical protein